MDNNEEKLHEQAEVIEKELEVAADTAAIRDAEIKVEGKLFHGVKLLIGSLLDQLLVVGLALVIFFIFEQLLKLAGYQIISKEEMFLIMYVISNVIYYPVAIEKFSGKTLGKKIMTR